VQVYSKPHFGGDGFGFWILAGDQDPTFNHDPDYLSGPVMGLKKDFQGVGVLFDVYDNDNRRNNPSVFVIKQKEGENRNFNHDQDFDTDMVTATHPIPMPMLQKQGSHKCVADIRNTGKVSRVVVKYLHQFLHVYIDTGDGTGFKVCLSVSLGENLRDHHLAFTAATGQVADQMDIFEVTTRYLKEADQEFDDDKLAHLGDSGAGGSYGSMFWFVVSAVGFGLTILTAYEWYNCRNMVSDQIDPVRICDALNAYVLPHYSIHIALTVCFLLTLSWLPLLVNAPVAGWRAWLIFKKRFKYSPASLSAISSKGHGVVGVHPSTSLMLTLVFYCIAEGVFVVQLARS